MVDQADLIVPVCPPVVAEEVAESVARIGFDGTYVDVNAVAPATARRIGARFERSVDGGIIGPPVASPGTTRLYLSGSEVDDVAALWRDSPLEVRTVDSGAGAASAVKTCFAAWTKGTAALLLTIRALAEAEGVKDALLAEWATSIPDLAEQSELTAFGNAPKAWRFIGEMEEIAESLALAGLPDGFAIAAAETYRRLANLKRSEGATLDEVVARVLPQAPPKPGRCLATQDHALLVVRLGRLR